MATPAQVDANRRNSLKSTGPRTEAGKAASRANATKHSLAGEAMVPAAPAAEERREAWSREYRVEGEAAAFALDRLIAATIQIERAEEAMNAIYASEPERARLAWDAQKEAEAAGVFARIGKKPGAVVARLKGSLHGVAQLEAAWGLLADALEDGGEWTEAEEAMALNLLGIPTDQRSGRTRLDGPRGGDRNEHRRSLVREELANLEATVEEVGELDLLDRRLAMAGLSTLNSTPARLVIRYEREAWRRFERAQRTLKPFEIPAQERSEAKPTPMSPPAAVAVAESKPIPTPRPEEVAAVRPARDGTKPIPGPARPMSVAMDEASAYAYADFRVGTDRPRR